MKNKEATIPSTTKNFIISCGIFFLFCSSAIQAQTSVWQVPEEADSLVNPVKPNESSIYKGKEIYVLNCTTDCHARNGKSKDIRFRDFTTEEFQSQSDGALFYKINIGRRTMPGFHEKLSEEEIWSVVNYLRTLKATDQK